MRGGAGRTCGEATNKSTEWKIAYEICIHLIYEDGVRNEEETRGKTLRRLDASAKIKG